MKKVLIIALLTASLTSCVAVKEYEKVNLSDPDMTLAQKKLDRFETSYQVYREAASGANGGKSGGGCGCN
ncbi:MULTISPECIES: DUF4266 domain-containing protein [Winogradskyella]|jgi:uncharacterized protein DUF4266|uniref:Uncharacterized protein DUF4266 n=1 Tax=Winogradskyella eximia TaxID=262006 RepID=A0A3D9H1S1_9FLAO|nr:DUF4266 domain-containing protein [Winogradskyella eximia]RED43442.1 uncharacterized protein DUF4266 [Winogradskyella eximia]|tara:strand:- start:297 stop:506 length:210 start_codon:yes stop_codon:yes gene_type:complete